MKTSTKLLVAFFLGACISLPVVRADDVGIRISVVHQVLRALGLETSSGIAKTPSISGRFAAVAAVAQSIVSTTPTVDTSYEVTSNVLVTTLGSGNFTVTVNYNDESNVARTLTLNFQVVAGTIGTAISTAAPYNGIPCRIRVKGGTTVTMITAGTFTGCTYNVEGGLAPL
jgi:hypothetical protein